MALTAPTQAEYNDQLGLCLMSPATPAHLAFMSGRGRWAFPRWLRYLNDVVTEFLYTPGEAFLAIEAPVRHGKSRYCSVAVPAWHVGMFPEQRVFGLSYSFDLIKGYSEEARDILIEYGPTWFGIEVSGRADEWDVVGHAGGMRAVPLGGGITGFGGNLIVIDDPIKNADEADSKHARDKLWSWYARVLRNRLEPGGKILLIMARWHNDDLRARLTDLSIESELADQWQVIHLPALAQPSPDEVLVARDLGQEIDLEEWRDQLGRRHGEALWPQRWPKSKLVQVRASVGERAFNANYQQAPTGEGGDMFPDTAWRYAEELPARIDLVRRWDLAASEKKSADYAAAVLVGYTQERLTYIIDVQRTKAEPAKLEEWVTGIVEADRLTYGKQKVHHVLEQEPGSSGKIVTSRYARDLFNKESFEGKPSGADKEMMARPLAGQVGIHNVYLMTRTRADGSHARAAWAEDFIDEASQFPYGQHDDMIDAASKGYLDLTERWEKRQKQKGRVKSAASRTLPQGPGSTRPVPQRPSHLGNGR